MNTRLTARPSARSARRQRWTVRRGTKRLRRSWRAGARWGRRRAARGSARSRPGPGRRRLAARAPPPADRRPPARSHARMLVVGCAAAGADQRDGGVHGRGRSRDVTSTSTRSRSRARSVPPSARGPLGVQCPRNDVRAGSTTHGGQAAPRSQPSRAAAALPRGAWAAVARAHPGAPPGRRHHGLRQPSQASRRRLSASHGAALGGGGLAPRRVRARARGARAALRQGQRLRRTARAPGHGPGHARGRCVEGAAEAHAAALPPSRAAAGGNVQGMATDSNLERTFCLDKRTCRS
jgi:hypothetical protein